MILAPLLLAAAVCAPAQEFVLPEQAGALVLSARESAAHFHRAPSLSPAASSDGDAFARALSVNGLWGAGKADVLPAAAAPVTAVSPLNQGFQGLGATGAKGRIVGPGLHVPGIHVQGDGTYSVTLNSAYKIVLRIQTGYIDGVFTLRRDASTGEDTLGFTGRIWNQKKNDWDQPTSGNSRGHVAYSASSDSGLIACRLNGEQQQDRFCGGRAGSRGMTIELTGYSHEFKQD